VRIAAATDPALAARGWNSGRFANQVPTGSGADKTGDKLKSQLKQNVE
jgi:hypothetical protein